ncbi:GNAT family N-acetyltransferase [Aestuariirhabdus sp. Z084]|uniref:GNAT family N-acyltransferase n=1 Tax=Aestuariirhabdus haliotis TaxID=2918751 RepID=UPI00201B42F0|nr:GNAT family N-acyltransferase [Aestuariirhabdus haliotis]MCL6414672.1 GNAT family N-acetyltransferase [Aestuariirhabdus haliotis]MCL6418604.1 GNAT family N-acetyltransferase [Aestuariirhabdus haliotis]
MFSIFRKGWGGEMRECLYEVFVADTEFARTINYHVRYQVYCEQKSYEEASDGFIDLERDEWDDRSVHFIVRDRESGEWCAALRLVKPNPGSLLPLESFSQIDDDLLSGRRHKAVELSRLCKPKVKGVSAREEGRSTGAAVLTLLSSVARYCRDHDYSELFCLTSPSVIRMMPSSWNLRPVGPAAEHRGTRFPYSLDIDSILGFYDELSPAVGYSNFSHAFGGAPIRQFA